MATNKTHFSQVKCSNLKTLFKSVSDFFTVSFQQTAEWELKLHKLNKTSLAWGICAVDIQVKLEQKLDAEIETAQDDKREKQ